jgi:hypothetical protein
MNTDARKFKGALCGVLLALFVLAGVLYGWDFYETRIDTPRDIQKRLLGREIVGYNKLLRYERDISGFGYAKFTWSYDLSPSHINALKSRCLRHDPFGCILAETKEPEGRYFWIGFRDNRRLTIEEWWD